MRQIKGVNLSELRGEAEPEVVASIESVINTHVSLGWLSREEEIVRLTRKGLFISDALWSEYL